MLAGTCTSVTSGACGQSTGSISSNIDREECSTQNVLTTKRPNYIGRAQPVSHILAAALACG